MRYWAKYRKDPILGVGKIHLLSYHLLDVAAVGYLMVTNNLFGAADTLCKVGLEGESGAQFFAWLLSSHDIGRVPRASGDEPRIRSLKLRRFSSSPRKRG